MPNAAANAVVLLFQTLQHYQAVLPSSIAKQTIVLGSAPSPRPMRNIEEPTMLVESTINSSSHDKRMTACPYCKGLTAMLFGSKMLVKVCLI